MNRRRGGGFFRAIKDLVRREETRGPSQGKTRNTVQVKAKQHITMRIEWRDELVPITRVAAVSRTTTQYKEGANAVGMSLAPKTPGYAEAPGYLVQDQSDPEFPDRVAVVVGDTIIGTASRLVFTPDTPNEPPTPAIVQLFTSDTARGFRVDAWVWAGPGEPKWQYTRDKRPPVTPKQKSREAQLNAEQTIREAIEEGGESAKMVAAGTVRGKHYLELIEPIKQLKREGRLIEALEVAYQAIEGVENEVRQGYGQYPAPFYTMQAAITLRKLRRTEEEKEVLRRWLAVCPLEDREDSKVAERLAKIEAKEQ